MRGVRRRGGQKSPADPRPEAHKQHEQGEPKQDADHAAGLAEKGVSRRWRYEHCGTQDADDGNDQQAKRSHRRPLLDMLGMLDTDRVNQLGALPRKEPAALRGRTAEAKRRCGAATAAETTGLLREQINPRCGERHVCTSGIRKLEIGPQPGWVGGRGPHSRVAPSLAARPGEPDYDPVAVNDPAGQIARLI